MRKDYYRLFIPVLVLIIVYLFYYDFKDILFSNNNMSKVASNNPTTPTITAIDFIPSSTPIILPTEKKQSERALRAAAFMYANSTKEKQKEIQTKYAGGLDNTALVVKNWAIALDNNPELLYYNEALIEKYKQEQNNYSNNNYNTYKYRNDLNVPSLNESKLYDSPDSLLKKMQQESRQRCQEEINRYTTCMAEYNSEMSESNSCLAEKVFNEWKICIKPTNICGIKPFCAY